MICQYISQYFHIHFGTEQRKNFKMTVRTVYIPAYL